MKRRNLSLVRLNLASAMAIAIGTLAVTAVAQNGAATKSPAKKAWTPTKTAFGQPDIQGIWSNASIIALERPKELEGKQTLTREEMRAYEAKVFARSSRERPLAKGQVGTYNDFWWDGNSKRAENLNTAIIVDPPDGKVPPLTPEAQRKADTDRAYARQHPADGPEDRTLLER